MRGAPEAGEDTAVGGQTDGQDRCCPSAERKARPEVYIAEDPLGLVGTEQFAVEPADRQGVGEHRVVASLGLPVGVVKVGSRVQK